MCRINKIYFACDHSHTVRISQCQAQKTHTARGLYLHEREELYVSCRAEDLSLIINLPGLCGKCLRVGPAAALLNTRNAIQGILPENHPVRVGAEELFQRKMQALDATYPKLLRAKTEVKPPSKSWAQMRKVRRKESLLSQEISNQPKKLDSSAGMWAADLETTAEVAEEEFKPAEIKPKKNGTVFVSEEFEWDSSEGWGGDSDEDASGWGGSSADSHSSDSELSNCDGESESHEDKSDDGDATEPITPQSSPELEASSPVKGGKCVLTFVEGFQGAEEAFGL